MTRPAASGLSWAVLGRFVEYVHSSGGAIEADGGAIVDSSGMPSWPLLDAADFDEGAGVLRFAGTVRFTAHFGALDIPLGAPTITTDGATGELAIAAAGPGHPAVVLARFGWRAVPAADGWRAWVGADVRLAGEAAHLFGGVYPPGTPLDPLVVVLDHVRNG